MSNENKIVDLKQYLEQKIPASKLVESESSEFNPSDINIKRALAFGIDLMAIGTLKAITTYSYALYLRTFFYELDLIHQVQMMRTLKYVDIGVTFALFLGYFIISNLLMQGSTIGKKYMKIVTVNNSYIKDINNWHFETSIGQSFKRILGYMACYASFGVLFALPFIRSDKKSLSEMFSKTTVMSTDDFHQLFIMKSKASEQKVVNFSHEKKVA